MKVFWSIIAYMVISGFLAGYVINEKYKDCGKPVKATPVFFARVLIWPVLLGTAIVVDDGSYAKNDCDA